MKLLTVVVGVCAASVAAQQYPECTSDFVKTDDCADVINPAACYNQFRWNARTLTCIEGTDDADRKRKACQCCSCVGAVMCDWVSRNRFCT